jgi:serine/threonine-protein kinase
MLPSWSGRRWAVVLGAAVIAPFVVGYFIAVSVLFPAPPVTEGGIPVPDLVGRTESEATAELSALGLGPAESTRLPHPTRPQGQVIAQSPLPGQQLRGGAAVRVAVSTGVPRAVVPDVVGFTEGRAAGLLQRLGFQVSRQIEDSAEPTGRVTRTDPEAGQNLALPARITVYVSNGVLIPPPLPDTVSFNSGWP